MRPSDAGSRTSTHAPDALVQVRGDAQFRVSEEERDLDEFEAGSDQETGGGVRRAPVSSATEIGGGLGLSLGLNMKCWRVRRTHTLPHRRDCGQT